jgi:hypothetical protein
LEMVPTGVSNSLFAGLLVTVLTLPASAQQVVELPARDRPLTDRPVELFAIGTIEGADWEMLSNVRSVAFDRDDNLYVLDGGNVRVLVFDAEGRYVRQFGKRGGGPGEFQAPLSMTVLPNGEVVVNDIGNRAFIVFNGAGEVLRNVSFDASVGMPLSALYAHPLGVVTRANPMPRADGSRARTSSIFVQPLRPDAEPMTLFATPLPEPVESAAASPRGGRMSIMVDPVFAPRVTFGVLPDGALATSYETEYRVHLVDRAGHPLRTVTRALEPRRVTRKDQEEYNERLAAGEGPVGQAVMITSTAGAGGGGGNISIGRPGAGSGGAPGAEAMRISMENRPFAEYMSVITRITADQQGRLWVQRRNTDAREQGPIDLVAADGRYIGTLPPQALPDAVSASDRAAYIVRDDLGVERVAVRRLPAGWR